MIHHDIYVVYTYIYIYIYIYNMNCYVIIEEKRFYENMSRICGKSS